MQIRNESEAIQIKQLKSLGNNKTPAGSKNMFTKTKQTEMQDCASEVFSGSHLVRIDVVNAPLDLLRTCNACSSRNVSNRFREICNA